MRAMKTHAFRRQGSLSLDGFFQHAAVGQDVFQQVTAGTKEVLSKREVGSVSLDIAESSYNDPVDEFWALNTAERLSYSCCSVLSPHWGSRHSPHPTAGILNRSWPWKRSSGSLAGGGIIISLQLCV